MRLLASRLAPVAVACIAGLASAPPAGASVTVGQLFRPTLSGCAAGVALMTGATNGNPYTIPSPGVISSWSFDDGAAIVPGLEFKVGRHVAGDDYKIVGTSLAGPQTPERVATYPTQIPVEAGDVIGMFEAGGDCATTVSSGQFTYEWIDLTNPPLGTTATFGPLDNAAFPVSALVEPDADRDGFGDETQDKCPTDASTHGTCPPPVPPKDTTSPSISAATGRTARLSRRGAFSFELASSEAVSGNATGTISLPRATRTVRFKTVSVKLAAGKIKTITLRLSRSNLKAVRAALTRHSLKAKITVSVRDAAGNPAVIRLSPRLTR